jgi:hypothetical protein
MGRGMKHSARSTLFMFSFSSAMQLHYVSKRVLFETDPALREKTQLLLFYGHPVKDLGLKDFWDWFSVFRPSPSTV